MTSKPLLSICIPTYNRAELLEKCLYAITEQEEFNEQVEIVISDNCSTDRTQEIGEDYSKRYNNIHYFRNESNLLDQNFPLSLQRAKGILRKLTNDTVIYRPGAIKYMLEAARDNVVERPQLFFLSKEKNDERPIDISDPEQYIDTLGVNMTWIRSLAFWEDDCEDLTVFSSLASTNMAQVPFLMRNFEKRGRAMVYPLAIMDMIEVKNKNLTYGLFKVFYTHFLGFIREWVEEGRISEACYQRLRKKLLLDFFSMWVVEQENKSSQYRFSDENLKQLVKDAYRRERYYPKYLIKKTMYRLGKMRLQVKGGDHQ